MNPLYEPFYFPPFRQISVADYEPAIDAALAEARAEIDAITGCDAAPTFSNTIEAFERTGSRLDRVLGVFYPLLSAHADDEMMEISLRVSARMSEYDADVSLNAALFDRIRAVYEQRESLELTVEQRTLLTNVWLGFTRSGANLHGADRQEYRTVKARLSELTTRFGHNIKKELAGCRLWLSAADLAGLPEYMCVQAAQAAASEGRDGEYLFTLEQPTYVAFMKYSERRDLRERMYRMYTGRNISGPYSNMSIMTEIAGLRLRLANLLGYDTFADYRLERSMAEKPSRVYDLLDRLREAYMPAMRKELKELSELAGHQLMPWDYSFYADRLRRQLYDFNEEELRPYFELSGVIDGVFGLASRLYGIGFAPATDIDVYHPDVRAFRVSDADGSVLGVLYADFFPRTGSKSPGAWMTEFREADATTRPLVSIVMNFTKPVGGKPSLLTPSEVETFLHEFGHALHALLTRASYSSLAGTNVFRDFVELPSQFNENFLTCRGFLDSFARHYQTGEPIPESMVERLIASARFGAAYACIRQLSFGYLDMAWHTVTAPVDDPVELERRAVAEVSPFGQMDGSLVSPQFGHIFSGGYAAGYYSYKWAEVLDADAFALFRERGIFDSDAAQAFRECILARGGTEHPARLYRRFRGRDATIDALLERDGIR